MIQREAVQSGLHGACLRLVPVDVTDNLTLRGGRGRLAQTIELRVDVDERARIREPGLRKVRERAERFDGRAFGKLDPNVEERHP